MNASSERDGEAVSERVVSILAYVLLAGVIAVLGLFVAILLSFNNPLNLGNESRLHEQRDDLIANIPVGASRADVLETIEAKMLTCSSETAKAVTCSKALPAVDTWDNHHCLIVIAVFDNDRLTEAVNARVTQKC